MQRSVQPRLELRVRYLVLPELGRVPTDLLVDLLRYTVRKREVAAGALQYVQLVLHRVRHSQRLVVRDAVVQIVHGEDALRLALQALKRYARHLSVAGVGSGCVEGMDS